MGVAFEYLSIQYMHRHRIAFYINKFTIYLNIPIIKSNWHLINQEAWETFPKDFFSPITFLLSDFHVRRRHTLCLASVYKCLLNTILFYWYFHLTYLL